MPVICPTITAVGPHEYREQMERVEPFARRVHIDLMDGRFAPTTSPALDQIWWKPDMLADIHLMYQRPAEWLESLVEARLHMVIIHAEAECDHAQFAEDLRGAGIKSGLALLQDTPVDPIRGIITRFNHILIFSGHLGYHGGEADLRLLDKVKQVRELHPEAEIGWDGGINDKNAKQLTEAGVDVLNVGGFIQKADDPPKKYESLESAVSE